MSYQPIIPTSGIGGWRFLQRTLETQQANFNDSVARKREIDYFLANIGKADTAEKLVADRRLLKVALEAFDLGSEIDKRAFIRQVLEGGTEKEGAMATRFADPRFREFAAAFGFGDAKGAQTGKSSFAQDVVARFRVRSFEEAVGAVDQTMRLALNFDRVVKGMASQDLTDRQLWLRVMGDKPVREVLEKALGMPKEFVNLDLDRQVEIFRTGVNKITKGDGFKALGEADARDAVIRRFMVRAQIEAGPSPLTRGFGALQLLQMSPLGGQGAANLFASRL